MTSAAGGFRLDGGSGMRCVRVQADLRKAWKKKIKKLPPSQREAWLRSQAGIAALGAQACHQLLGLLEARQSALVAGSAAADWVDAWVYHNELPPGLDFNAQGRLVGPAGSLVKGLDGCSQRVWPDGRQHAVRLVLSQVATSSAAEAPSGSNPGAEPVMGAATRRWTPPQAVGVEDLLDGMSMMEAMFYEYPVSPSARAIQGVEAAKGREKEQRTRAVSKSKYRRICRQVEARGERIA